MPFSRVIFSDSSSDKYLENSSWKWLLIADLPIKNDDFR